MPCLKWPIRNLRARFAVSVAIYTVKKNKPNQLDDKSGWTEKESEGEKERDSAYGVEKPALYKSMFFEKILIGSDRIT